MISLEGLCRSEAKVKLSLVPGVKEMIRNQD